MPITINPPLAVNIAQRESGGNSLVPEFLPTSADNIIYKGMTVRDALDELVSALASPSAEGSDVAVQTRPKTGGWQKFTSSGDFIVPEDVNSILVMCIGAGASTSSNLGGGTFISRRFTVTPGESFPVQVGMPQSPGGTITSPVLETMTSRFNGGALAASFNGYGFVDGTGYSFSNAAPTIPDWMKDKGVVTLATVPYAAPATSTRGTDGRGGYAVPRTGALNERAAWLELARDMTPGTAPTGRECYPDTTQLSGAASGVKGGFGANYGGSAGCWGIGQGVAGNASRGGDGLVCVFWGEDIDVPEAAPDTRLTRVARRYGKTITPQHFMYDATHLPYTNEEAGLAEGSTVADALEMLYARLSQKEQKE